MSDLGFEPDVRPDDDLGFEPEADPRETQPAGTVQTGRVSRELVLPETSFAVDPRGRRPDVVTRGEEFTQIEEREVQPETAQEITSRKTQPRQPVTSTSDRLMESLLHSTSPGRVFAEGAPLFGLEAPTARSMAAAREDLGRAQDPSVLDALLSSVRTSPRPEGMGPSAPDRRSQAGVLGLGTGATFGFLDELQGAGSELTGGDYTTSRDAARQYLGEARQQAPLATALGELAPALGSGIGGGAVGATAGARIGSAARMGAVLGGARGAGEAQDLADLPGSIGEGGTLGALAGAGGQGLGEGLGAALGAIGRPGGPIARDVGDVATGLRLRASGMNPFPAASTQAAQDVSRFPGGRAGYAAWLRQQGVGGAIPNPAQASRDAERIAAQSGARIGEIRGALDDAGAQVDTRAYVDEIDRLARELEGARVARVRAAGPRMRSELIDPNVTPPDIGIEGPGNVESMGFGEAHELRKALDDLAGNFRQENLSQPAGQAMTARRFLNDLMSQGAEDIDPALRSQWQTANRGFQGASILRSHGRGTTGGLSPAITEAIGSAQMMAGDPTAAVTAAAGRGISQFARDRLTGLSAVGMERLARALQAGSPTMRRAGQQLQQAMQRGPNAAAAAHYLLSQQSPEYRQAAEAAQQEQQ